ncbi:MAG: right-handed parallel beta-helix repeat-containing protein [Phycisphaerales bacterium]
MNEIERRVLLGAAGAGALAAVASAAGRGPINPPAGSVGSTGKMLSEVEPRTPISSLPFVISTPGSYYLTGNLAVSSPTHGITVNASGVEIDLNGFALTGVNSNNSSAIQCGSSLASIAVRNGRLLNWWGGVDVRFVTRARVENVECTGPGTGVNVSALGIGVGPSSAVINCAVSGFGICINVLGTNNAGGIVSNCRVTAARDIGILTGALSLVEGCSVIADAGASAAAAGIQVGNGSVVRGCTISNWAQGVATVFANSQAAVIGCEIAGSASAAGIVAPSGRLLAEGCQIVAGTGISCGDGSLVRNCTVSNVSAARSGSAGITTGNIARVEGCTVFSYADGIIAAVSTTLERCTVNNCTTAVRAGSYCAVRDCTLDYGTTGVFANGVQLRVVDNKISRFDPCVNCNDYNSSLVARNQFSETGANPVINANGSCAVGPLLVAGSGAGGIAAAGANPWGNVRI